MFVQIRKVENMLSERQQRKRRRTEFGEALQYSTIVFRATLTWISFVIYHRVIPFDQPHWFAFVVLGITINSCINALIEVRFNRDLYAALMLFVFGRSTAPATTTLALSVFSSRNSSFVRRYIRKTEMAVMSSTN